MYKKNEIYKGIKKPVCKQRRCYEIYTSYMVGDADYNLGNIVSIPEEEFNKEEIIPLCLSYLTHNKVLSENLYNYAKDKEILGRIDCNCSEPASEIIQMQKIRILYFDAAGNTYDVIMPKLDESAIDYLNKLLKKYIDE